MKLLIAIVAVVVALFRPVPGVAQSFDFPASWEGEWEFTEVTTACESSTVISTVVDTTGICAMDPFNVEPDTRCAATEEEGITATDLVMHCTSHFDFSPLDCSATLAIHTVLTRSGDSITGTETVTLTYFGTECGEIGTDECEEITVTGVRLSNTPLSCITPVETMTWGRIKTLYN